MYLLGNPFLTVKVKNPPIIVPLIQRYNLMHCRQGFTLAKQSNITGDRTGSTFIPPMEPEILIQINYTIPHGTDRMRHNDTDTDRHNTGKNNDK